MRRSAGRVPLWTRLVVAMLALVALAQLATGAVVLAALDRYLMGRVDEQLAVSARATAGRAGVQPGDLVRLGLPGLVFVRVVNADGTTDGELFSDGQPHGVPPDVPAVALSDPDTPRTVQATSGGGQWRLITEPVRNDPDRMLVMAVRLDDQRATVAQLAVLDILVSGGVLALLAGVGYLLVRASLRPLRQVEAVAAEISAGQLSRRVPEADPRTEVGRLSQGFNAMLSHIEGALHAREAAAGQARASEERMRQFVADAGHELRTPLTSIRGFAELYRQGAAAEPTDVARFMGRIEDESSRMSLLIDDLLLLARLDQQRPMRRAPVDLAVLASDAVHDARAVAPARPLTLEVAGPVPVLGDEPRLRQVVANLVSNALTHTPVDVPVTVRASSADGSAVLEVADLGPGLAPEHAARVFERFYRADPSRTRQTGGNGLGLAIVAAIVAGHGGTIDVATAPGAGATFQVRLPGVPAEAPADGNLAADRR